MSVSMHRPAPHRWLDDPVESGAKAGFGLYLHVPFCVHRCGYCDFATEAVPNPLAAHDVFQRYAHALKTEISGWAHTPPDSRFGVDAWPTVTSVFVGGGTPTLLPEELLSDVISHLRDTFDVADTAEVTVECNPETASESLFSSLHDAGVNRMSFGAQSSVASVLATLERRHTPGRVGEAIAQAQAAGITNLSVDLLYGTPGETDDDFAFSVAEAIRLGVTHVSAYALTVHDNTPFGRAVAAGQLPAPDPDVQRDRFEQANTLLGAAGFHAYELSNFAQAEPFRSAHNTLYWRHGNYLGMGVGAHSHMNGHRWWLTRATARYLDAWETTPGVGMTFTNWPALGGFEALTADERAVERLMLGLRLAEGLHPHDLPAVSPDALEDAMRLGLVETACGRVRSTSDGWFLLDEAVRTLLV